MINYFVSYYYTLNNNIGSGYGYGNVDIQTKQRIQSIEDVRKIEEVIKQKNNIYEKVILINWKRF